MKIIAFLIAAATVFIGFEIFGNKPEKAGVGCAGLVFSGGASLFIARLNIDDFQPEILVISLILLVISAIFYTIWFKS